MFRRGYAKIVIGGASVLRGKRRDDAQSESSLETLQGYESTSRAHIIIMTMVTMRSSQVASNRTMSRHC